MKVVLPGPVADQLAELAKAVQESPSTLAARMIRHGVAVAAKDGKIRPLRPAQAMIVRGRSIGRPSWLEPYGGDAAWRKRMWGEIVALHGRYPKALAQLKDEWWTEELHTEILCALASWRAELDEKAQDPREEIAFHAQLADYAHRLQKESTGITTTWKPGAPPDGWVGTTPDRDAETSASRLPNAGHGD